MSEHHSTGVTPSNFVDLTGHKYNLLTVVRRIVSDKKWVTQWECLCDCGKTTIATTGTLRSGAKKSCGCEKGYLSHRMSGTPEYKIWASMKSRCCNPKNSQYPSYGGRGISVCDDWKNSFESFISHIGRRPTEKHSLDRIDNDKGYEPGNVRWATKTTQARNTRSRSRKSNYKGVSKDEFANLSRPYKAQILNNYEGGKINVIHIGRYESIEEAAGWWDLFSILLKRYDTKLNFESNRQDYIRFYYCLMWFCMATLTHKEKNDA